MQLRRQADDRGGASHLRTHGVLRPVHVADDLRQRAVVADGAGQHERHALLDAGVHDAVADAVLREKRGDRSAGAHAVDHVDVVIVPVGHRTLGVDVLPERRAQQCALQVMRRQRVARHQPVAEAPLDQRGHRVARIGIERAGRAEHPENPAVLALVAQQLVELVVIAGIRRLARTVVAERKALVRSLLARVEAVRMDVDALAAILRAAEDDRVARADIAELAHGDLPLRREHGNAVHAALLRQQPAVAHMEVLRENRRRVVALRHHAVPRSGPGHRLRRMQKAECRKIRRVILGKRKGHRRTPLSFFSHYSRIRPQRKAKPSPIAPAVPPKRRKDRPRMQSPGTARAFMPCARRGAGGATSPRRARRESARRA